MKSSRTRNLIIGGAAVLAIAAGGATYAIADGSKEKEKTLTAVETQKAEAAAAREVSGRVLYVEYEEDHGGGYEVEMQLKDGSEADVYLDKSFEVVGIERGEHGEKAERGEHGEKGYETGNQGEYGAAEKANGPAMQGEDPGR